MTEYIKLYLRYDLTLRCPSCWEEQEIQNIPEGIPTKITCSSCKTLYDTKNRITHARLREDESRVLLKYLEQEEQKMEYEMKKGLVIPDGVHVGKIVAEEVRNVQWNGKEVSYQDLELTDDSILVDNKPIRLRVSYPANLSENSALYKTLERLGVRLNIGEKFDSKTLVGRKVAYQTMTKKTDRGEFAEVLKDTVKAV